MRASRSCLAFASSPRMSTRKRSRDASSISPRDFIQQNTTQDGEAIDVRIQQDATEFLAK